ncbi:MAG TPA: hypothetical protein VGA64_07770, partial [Candidatus Polarisedimenticolia bacterium]
MIIRKIPRVLAIRASLGMLTCLILLTPSLGRAQVGSNNPTDDQLLTQRALEVVSAFVVAVPPPGTVLRPVQRVPRSRFGVVGNFPLTLQDLDALVYPS